MVRRVFGVFGLMAALAAGGCASDWQERYEQSQRENLDLVEQMDTMRTSQATDAARAEAAAAQAKALERENQKLLAERNDAAQAARKAQADLEAAAKSRPAPVVVAAPSVHSQAESLASKMEKTFPGKVRVTDHGDVEITLASDVTFASGSDILSDGARKSLRQVAGQLTGEFAEYPIRVVGHTDNDPVVKTKAKYGDNLGLSTARANSVARFMSSEMRIDPSRITPSGRGEQAPIADNKTSAGKAKNRRVEIVVVTSASAK